MCCSIIEMNHGDDLPCMLTLWLDAWAMFGHIPLHYQTNRQENCNCHVCLFDYFLYVTCSVFQASYSLVFLRRRKAATEKQLLAVTEIMGIEVEVVGYVMGHMAAEQQWSLKTSNIKTGNSKLERIFKTNLQPLQHQE